jgi:hypothetical protein
MLSAKRSPSPPNTSTPHSSFSRELKQYVSPSNPTQRVALSFSAIPHHLIESTSQVKLVVAFTSYNTRMHILFSCSLQAPSNELSSETLAGVVRVDTTQCEVPVVLSGTGPVVSRVGGGIGEDVALAFVYGTIWPRR